MRKLNVVHVCDHLGWAGSRMHGVKRLFAWMMPRFDRVAHHSASLVSLRKKDLSDGTLEQLGIDVTYLGAPQVRSGDVHASVEGAAGQAGRRRPPARLRRHDLRTAVCGVDGHSRGAARAREPHRHAVVPEARRQGARALHRHRHRGLGVDGGIHDACAARCRPIAPTSSTSVRRSTSSRARARSTEEIAAARARPRHSRRRRPRSAA